MIALALLLSTAPFADHFWVRDLGALARDLAENRDDPQAAFFGDLLRLCDCEPLGAVADGDPLRALLRVEEARRIRLGAGAAKSGTIFRDVLRPDFFRRDPGNPAEADALEWPDEEERWTGERLLVAPPRFACAAAAGKAQAPQEKVSRTLVAALLASGHPEAASVLAYYQAVLLLRAEKPTDAAVQAQAIEPERLGPLSRWGSLLRIVTGVDDRLGALALARDWEGDGASVARVLAIDAVARAGKWADAVATSEDLPARAPAALLAHARLLRSRALFETGRLAAARSALPLDDRTDLVRDLAIELLAANPLDAGGLQLASALFPDTSDALLRVARRALAIGSLGVARSAATRLDPSEPRARALIAEVAFASDDAPETGRALNEVLEGPLPRGMRRSSRDRAVAELCRSLVELAPRASGQLRAEAARILVASREDLGLSAQKAVDSAVAALRVQGAAAIGVVRVGSTLPLPDLPRLQVDWPEPRSLLEIPDGKGGTRDWFPEATTLAGGPKT
jgi:hypothetical protein